MADAKTESKGDHGQAGGRVKRTFWERNVYKYKKSSIYRNLMFHVKHFATNLYEFPNDFIHTNYTIPYTLRPYSVCIKK